MGKLTFSSTTPFNVVEITMPRARTAASDFFEPTCRALNKDTVFH